MKRMVLINFNVDDFPNPQDFEEIVQLYPAGVRYGQFSWETEAENSSVCQILEKLHAKGFVPWVDTQRKRLPTEYAIDYEVKFETGDLKRAQYLFLDPTRSLDDACTTSLAGELVLDTEKLYELDAPTTKKLFSGTLPLALAGAGIVVSNGFKETLERAQLAGVEFVDKFRVTGSETNRIPEKYWILGSNVIAPRPSRSMNWVDTHGNPVEPDASADYRRAPGEVYRYDQSSLMEHGGFDCAILWEWRNKDLRFYAISQRFYQLCRKAQVDAEWEPIEILKDT